MYHVKQVLMERIMKIAVVTGASSGLGSSKVSAGRYHDGDMGADPKNMMQETDKTGIWQTSVIL